MEDVKHFLEDIGIHIGLLMAGLFGAYLSVSVNAQLNGWQKATVMVSGAMTANYITPLILNYINLGNQVQYGLAFIVGFSGLKFVEWIIIKIKNKIDKQQ